MTLPLLSKNLLQDLVTNLSTKLKWLTLQFVQWRSSLFKLIAIPSFSALLLRCPDWVVGRSNVNLLERGRFVRSFVLRLNPYDAGTDSGMTFSATGTPTNPRKPISMLSKTSLDGTTITKVVVQRLN